MDTLHTFTITLTDDELTALEDYGAPDGGMADPGDLIRALLDALEAIRPS